jgi:probable F420-dependent oxidoreductase
LEQVTAPRFGTLGLWISRASLTEEVAAEAERLGYGAIWIGGSPGAELAEAERALAATEHVVVATGIVNIWRVDAAEAARSYHRLEERFPGRFVLGIGSGHREADAERRSPLKALSEYLDVLDAAGVPADRRLLAALGPKTMELAARRSLGIHPYLTTPAHTREARELLGPGPLIAPELMVVSFRSEGEARAAGREILRRYLAMTNYVSTLRRLGFTDADLDGDGSDELVDRLTVWGDDAHLAASVRAHLDAGADHVCVQILPQRDDPRETLQRLATALTPGE